MKLAIMQPYFFPYLGYYQLMELSDRWIVFDDVQYVNKGWVNRNRILHSDVAKEWQYITVPLDNKSRFDNISDISIKNTYNWREQILGKLTSYKRRAPYYNDTFRFVSSCLDTSESNLSEFLLRTIKMTVEYLGLDVAIDVQSKMNFELNDIKHPGQWALKISEKVGASEYVNPLGGANIFKKNEFDDHNIKLTFVKTKLSPYVQRRGSFVAGLSIIDVLMWNNLDEVRKMIKNDYELVESRVSNSSQ